jgi:hypothetical protein
MEPRAIPRTKPNVNDRYARADTTTPLPATVGQAAPNTPESPADEKPARPIIVLSTTVAYRGRIITIANDGMTLDQFCDMLDKKFGATS